MDVNGDYGVRNEVRTARRHLTGSPARRPLSPGSPAARLPAGSAERLSALPPAAVLPAALAAGAVPAVPVPAVPVPGVAVPVAVPVPAQAAPDGAGGRAGRVPGTLPGASRPLAVIARPGQESAELGAVLSAYHLRGAQVAVLCLTRGEASEMNSTCERLESVRPWELQVAAGLLGVTSVTVADYPDGRLGYLPPATITEHIQRAVRRTGADLLLVVDPAAVADLDTAAVARAARLAAEQSGLPLLARTLPGPGGRWLVDLGLDGPAARACQLRAIDAHRSQRSQPPGPGPLPAPGEGAELVRWLVPPAESATPPAPGAPARVPPGQVPPGSGPA